ncbi:MAG TPA: DUF2934 domain-containing protein [Gemmataceae bacterium]|nr:DUF2934 domain-containing protein [Gemmataceae bacterium]
MLTFLGRSLGNVLGVRVSGEVMHADEERLLVKLERLLREDGKVHVLLELAAVQAWAADNGGPDLNRFSAHGGALGRCAIVEEGPGQEYLTRLTQPFRQVRRFRPAEVELAWQWVLEGVQEEVERRAYLKWEAAGKPPGDGTRFWLAAERELLAANQAARNEG